MEKQLHKAESRWIRWLFDPFDRTEATETLYVRYVAATLLVFAILTMMALAFGFMRDPSSLGRNRIIGLGIVGIVLLSYVIARLNHPKVSVWTVVVMVFTGALAIIFNPANDEPTLLIRLFYLTLPVTLTALFLSFRAQVFIASLTLSLIVSLPFLLERLTVNTLFINLVLVMMLFHLLALAAGYARLKAEQVRNEAITEKERQTERFKQQHDILKSRAQIIMNIMSDYTYELYINPDDPNDFIMDDLQGAYEQISGYHRDSPVFKKGWTILHPEDTDRARQHIRTAFSGQPDEANLRIITRDGTIRWIRNHAHPRRDETGKIYALTCVGRDITERLERERRMETHVIQQAIIAELGQRVLRLPYNSVELTRNVVELLQQVLHVHTVIVAELGADGVTLVYHQLVGWPDDLECVGRIDSIHTPIGDSVRTGEMIVIERLSEDKRYNQSMVLKQARVVSGVCVPLPGVEKPIGGIAVYSPREQTFSPDDLNFLQSIANVLAAFIEQKRTEAAEKAQRAAVDAQHEIVAVLNSSLGLNEVLDTILNNLSRLVRHDTASIMLIDDDDYARIIRHHGFAPEIHDVLNAFTLHIDEDPIMKIVFETRHGIVVADVRERPDLWEYALNETMWIRSYMGAPIFYKGEPLGLINVDSARPGAFNEQDLRRLEALADQVSIAIRNARHTEELEDRVRRRTAELEVERRSVQTILDSTGEGIFYAEEGIIHYANETLAAMTGYHTDVLIGQQATVLFDLTDDALWSEIVGLLQDERIWRGEMKIKRADGRLIEAGATLSLAGQDQRSRMVAILRDISAEKALQAQKARFIASASHELRTPVTLINTRLYLMKRDPAHMSKHMELLESAVGRIRRLIEDLLDMSRFENGVIQLKRHDTNLQELVAGVARHFEAEAEQRDIEFRVELCPEPLTVNIDSDRIEQVLTNLMNNALNYTRSGGMVTVKLNHDAADALIEVRDTGIGIAAEDIKSIFQPFFRGSGHAAALSRGTGLGLGISLEIARLHDGDITVTSTPGEGSVFCVHLPLIVPVSDKPALP